MVRPEMVPVQTSYRPGDRPSNVNEAGVTYPRRLRSGVETSLAALLIAQPEHSLWSVAMKVTLVQKIAADQHTGPCVRDW